MGFPPARNYKNKFGINADQLLTIYILLAYNYAEIGDIHLCIPQSTLSVLIQEVWGHAPSRNVLKINARRVNLVAFQPLNNLVYFN